MLMFWIIFGLLISSIINITTEGGPIDKKIGIKIYLRKRKKFLTKTTPIYKLERDEYSSYWYIKKYILKYHDDNWYNIFFKRIIPWPITIYSWSYYYDKIMYLSEDVKSIEDAINFIGDRTMDVVYEILKKVDKDYTQSLLTKKQLAEKRLNEINKIYIENYEK